MHVAESLHALQVIVVVHLCAILEVALVIKAICKVASILRESHHVMRFTHVELLLRELLLRLIEEFLVHLQVLLIFAHRL